MADDRPKLIYVAHRHPRYSHEEFIRRWRQHAALGMSQSRWRNVALYLHCDRVDGLTRSLPILECDGVAIVVYRSEPARQAHIADEGARRTMKADELDTFAQPVATTSLLVRETPQRPPRSGAARRLPPGGGVERDGPRDDFRLFVFWPSASTDQARYAERLVAGADVALTRNRPASDIGHRPWASIDELASPSVEKLDALAVELQPRRSRPAQATAVHPDAPGGAARPA
jgi:hypothetical protein